VTLAALVIAISAEFSVLLSERFRAKRAAGAPTGAALERTHRAAGGAALASGTTGLAGFALLTVSDIRMRPGAARAGGMGAPAARRATRLGAAAAAQAVAGSRTCVTRIELPDGSRSAASMPYGRSSGSSTNSTPRPRSSR
jgi:uncharacterized membrane protein YdfJ with MMPL/SSD domain